MSSKSFGRADKTFITMRSSGAAKRTLREPTRMVTARSKNSSSSPGPPRPDRWGSRWEVYQGNDPHELDELRVRELRSKGSGTRTFSAR
jgi:hypothetical protein